MTTRTVIRTTVSLLALVSLSACAKSTPPSETPSEPPAEAVPAEEPEAAPLAGPQESTDQVYVEGVAGGVMTSTVTLEAEVVSVDQEKKEAVLRDSAGSEVTVRVGKNAVNFYQVEVGNRVKVTMARELLIYVNDEGAAEEEEGTVAAGAGSEKGEKPAGAVVASTKVTSKIEAMDTEARTATLVFTDGKKQTFNVRPDVDMTKYKVGQEVVFLVTEMLALEVEAL